jgi:CxxC-x17-CxxC domain-containing protein
MIKEDRVLTCRDCGSEFAFTAGEQRFYAERGFHDPARCPNCRSNRRQLRMQAGDATESRSPARTDRQLYPAVCASCGQDTMVPFEPRSGRPVYCRDCYQRVRQDS